MDLTTQLILESVDDNKEKNKIITPSVEMGLLEDEIKSCNKCTRLRSITPIPMPHILYCKPENVKILAIGRNPGIEDDYNNISHEEFMEIYRKRWWECRVGSYLRKRLGDELIRNNFFFTNVCKCSSPKNATLSPSEKEKCRPFLKRQIEIIKPKVILTFSRDAKDIISDFIKDHEYYIDESMKGIPVFFLYHPSYFRYAQEKYGAKQDFILKEIRKKICNE